MNWPLSMRETLVTFGIALGAIYIANMTGLRQRVLGG